MDQNLLNLQESPKKLSSSHTSSALDNNSLLNTEEEKKSELSDHENSPKLDRFQYYHRYDSTRTIHEIKSFGHKLQIEERYKILQFSK